jgi:hypothetical protein
MDNLKSSPKKSEEKENEIPQNEYFKSYYIGIWNCKERWEKAKEILLKQYTEENYVELFNIDNQIKYNFLRNIITLKNKIGKEAVFDFILPIIQSIALSSEKLKEKKFLILTNNNDQIIELSQFECASILSTFFLNMFGNFTEGRNEKELNKGHYDLSEFPFLSFSSYFDSSGIMYQKFLFIIRYFIKIGIRMSYQKYIVNVPHFNFILSKDEILDKIKDYKDKLNEIYNFDEELEYDWNCNKNSILKIYLNEFNPYLYNKELQKGEIEKNEINCLLNQEFKEILSKNGYLTLNDYKACDTVVKKVFFSNNEEITLNTLIHTNIHLDSITEQKDCIITNFANKYLGGGCMNEGCVQEEILLLICPEILVARAFVKKMNHIQSISMAGFEKISKYKGYGFNLKFDGCYIDDNKYENNSFKSLMIAVDAIPIYSLFGDQFDFLVCFREFIKFITGLQGNNKEILNYKFNFCATGKWGCGAFGGNVYIKFLIQFLACLFSDVGFNFSCFNDKKNQYYLNNFIENFSKIIKKSQKKITKGLIFEAFFIMDIKKEEEDETILECFNNTLKYLLKKN